jgi:hypothetical protein
MIDDRLIMRWGRLGASHAHYGFWDEPINISLNSVSFSQSGHGSLARGVGISSSGRSFARSISGRWMLGAGFW